MTEALLSYAVKNAPSSTVVVIAAVPLTSSCRRSLGPLVVRRIRFPPCCISLPDVQPYYRPPRTSCVTGVSPLNNLQQDEDRSGNLFLPLRHRGRSIRSEFGGVETGGDLRVPNLRTTNEPQANNPSRSLTIGRARVMTRLFFSFGLDLCVGLSSTCHNSASRSSARASLRTRAVGFQVHRPFRHHLHRRHSLGRLRIHIPLATTTLSFLPPSLPTSMVTLPTDRRPLPSSSLLL
jgi:hypothetical protein